MIKEDLTELADWLAGPDALPDFADRALRDAKRRRGRRAVLASGGALALAGLGVPLVLRGLDGVQRGATPDQDVASPSGPRWTEPVPGGGPQAIQAYVYDHRVFVLNPRTARYDELPAATASLSPDGTNLAVAKRGTLTNSPMPQVGGEVGIADREELAERGAAAIRWAGYLAATTQPFAWSPDGTKLLVVSQLGGWLLDVRTGQGNTVSIEGADPFFAPDGQSIISYLATDFGYFAYSTLSGVRQRTLAVHEWSFPQDVLYSPDGSHAIAGHQVYDTVTWRPVSSILPNPVGWYDGTHVVVVNTTTLQVLGFDGRAVKTIPVAPTGRDFEKPKWPDKLWRVDIRSSRNLTGAAARYGF